MKKIIVMCMVALMAFGGLTACGNAEQTEVKDSLAQAPTEETEEKSETEETDLQSTEETDTAEPEKERTFPEPVYGDTRIRLSWGEDVDCLDFFFFHINFRTL